VSFPAPGTFPFELDYSECCDGDLAFTVTANGAPIPQIAQLALDVRGIADGGQVQGQQHVEVAVTAGQAQQVELLVDGKSRGISHAPPFSFDWDTSQETPGRHQVLLRGQDATGAIADKQLTLDVVAAAPLPTFGPAPVAAAPVAPAQDSNGPLLAAGTILLLLLAGVGLYFVMRGSREPAAAVAAPAAPAPAKVEDKTEFIGRGAISDLTVLSNRRPQALPKAKLLVKPDREVALSRSSETVIGRDASNAAAVDDRQVSRHHARIICADGDFWIEDLNSTNGTRVNGVKVEKQKLADNDQIGVGDTILTFTLERP
jgi:FHA domain